MGLYEILWRLSIPLLKHNARLKEGFDSRYSAARLEPADVWIHAASAGEAFLALSLIENINPFHKLRVLITTNTRQGFDIVTRGITPVKKDARVSVRCNYVPFDRPRLMNEAVVKVAPKLVILLETEIWPGLLFALKKKNIKTIIINGRLTPRSLKRYMLWPKLWKIIGPDHILAISEEDAGRFAELFGQGKVEKMPNIKFDRLTTRGSPTPSPLADFIPDDAQFLVLGSVRQPEEKDVERIICEVRSAMPETIIGLFPRHMQRIGHWSQTLDRLGINWQLRSRLDGKAVLPGTVILWDIFGELNSAYAVAKAVFVGGSLAPLGGQNFLEPMIYGVTPVIGPSWENFAWAGDELFSRGLAVRTENWQSVASELISRLRQPSSAQNQKIRAANYIQSKKGGTAQACRLISTLLNTSFPTGRTTL